MKRSAPLQRKTPMKRTGKPLARSRLNPVSKDPKKRKANAAYEAAKRKWRAEHDGRCEMMFTIYPRLIDGAQVHAHRSWLNSEHPAGARCLRRAGKNPHHAALRGPNLCNIETFLGLCSDCHRWVHEHAREARRLGYLIRTNPNPDK